MRHLSKKRFLVVGGAVTTVAAGAALLAGATFGFFSSAGDASGGNTFTAGTVVVGLDGGTQVTCAIDPMSPGDSQASGTNAACTYNIEYTGNVRAYMALDLAITGTPGSPIETPYGSVSPPTAKQGLFDGTATGLQFSIADDDAVNYVSGTTYLGQGVTGAVNLTPTLGAVSVDKLLVNATPITTGETKQLTVNYSLPTGAGNAYNLATSTIVLTIHAVQADNITLPGSCAAGKRCLTSMTWL
ncbi:MAG: hypothetical protein QOG43_1572 [Actinomycetota bacterium]|nr:hypothetical protein [Actinomycetota bacterium]